MLLAALLFALFPAVPQGTETCIEQVTSLPLFGERPVAVGDELYILGTLNSGVWRIARAQGDGWDLLPGVFDGELFSLAETALGLVAAGDFQSVDGAPAAGVAVQAGGTWLPLGAGFDPPYSVRALEVQAGELFAAGEFASSAGAPLSNIARWDGTFWRTLGGGLNAPATSIASFNGLLFVGGSFTSAGGQALTNVAAWNGTAFEAGANGSVPPVFDFALSQPPQQQLLAAAGGVYELDGGTWRQLGLLEGFTSISARAVGFADGVPVASGPWLTFCLSQGYTPCAALGRYDGTSWSLQFFDEFGPDIDELAIADTGAGALLSGLCLPNGECSILRMGDQTILSGTSPVASAWYEDRVVELDLGCLDPALGGNVRIDGAASYPVQFPVGELPNFVLPAEALLPGHHALVFEQGTEVTEPRTYTVLPRLTALSFQLFGPSVQFDVVAATDQGSVVYLYSSVLQDTSVPFAGVFGFLGLDLASLKVIGIKELAGGVFKPPGGPTLTVTYPAGTIPPGTSVRVQALVIEAPDLAALTNVEQLELL